MSAAPPPPPPPNQGPYAGHGWQGEQGWAGGRTYSGTGLPVGPPPLRPPGFQGFYPGMRASFWQRAGGYLLDGLFLNVALWIVIALFMAVFFAVFFATQSVGAAVGWIFLMYFLILGLSLGAQIWYETLAGRPRGQTYGKHICRTVVVDANTGQPGIGAGRSVVRFLARWVSGAIIIGFLWMLWDPQQRTLHDMMTNTTVVQGFPERVLGPGGYWKSLNDPPGSHPYS